jgi:hypothetical protein
MAIIVRCNCGKKLQVADDMAGKHVRCGACKEVLTVPAAAPEPPMVRPAESEPPRRPKRAKNAGGGSKVWLFALLGVAAVLLLGCLGVVSAGIYYFGFSGKSFAESTLVGDWESDPEPYDKAAAQNPFGVNLALLFKMTFNKDHTYRMSGFVDCDGDWRVVSRDGNKATVKMRINVIGLSQEGGGEGTATITIIDKDHIEFNANEPKFQLYARLRRVGSGGPPLTTNDGKPVAGGAGPQLDPNAPKSDRNAPGLGNRGKANPDLDKGMVADCEVEWGGQWFDAKVLKKEKDRWFIHYIGWGSNWDEWVTKERIRFKK